MKNIDYSNKDELTINGMYYVVNIHNPTTNYEKDKNAASIVVAPSGAIVKPALDYLIALSKQKAGKNSLNDNAKSIAHFFNFLRLFNLTGEEKLSNEILDAYINYLAVLPKGLFSIPCYRDTHPKDVEYLPVHPYINGTAKKEIVIKIYNDWYKRIGSNTEFLYTPDNTMFDKDEKDWRYPLEYIIETVRRTLNFLDWLSNNKFWKHRYSEIDPMVTIRVPRKIKRGKKEVVHYVWDVYKRVRHETELKPVDNSISFKRCFWETEFIDFFNSSTINNDVQKKLYFLFLALTGTRESECLNLLIKNLPIETEGRGKNKKYIIHWEELLIPSTNSIDKYSQNDILIDKYLDFYIRIDKRNGRYESSRRKNKKNEVRIVKLRDYNDFPEILSLSNSNIFIDSAELTRLFAYDLTIHNKNEDIFDFIEKIIRYHMTQRAKGIKINDPNYNSNHRDWILLLRKIIEECWLGNLLRTYLIERYKLVIEKVTNREIDNHFLFLMKKPYKGYIGPHEPSAVREWFKQICNEKGINRLNYTPNIFTGHLVKNSLSVHSFRHTYVTCRIGHETLNGKFDRASLANLQKEIGHVEQSLVTTTRYYYLDRDRKKRATSAIYKFLQTHIDNIELPNETVNTNRDEENNASI